MTLDRNGEPFEGTADELKRHNAKLKKQAQRAGKRQVSFLLEPRAAEALDKVLAFGGMSLPVELFSQQVLKLAQLVDGDPAAATMWLSFGQLRGDLSKWLAQINPAVDPQPEVSDDD